MRRRKPTPKSGSRTGQAQWGGRLPLIDDDAWSEMMEALGLAPNFPDPMPRAKVNMAIDLYHGVSNLIDRAPRASDYQHLFERLGSEAETLSASLAALDQRFRDQLIIAIPDEADLAEVERAIRTLRDAAAAIAARCSEESSDGRDEHSALYGLIANLRTIFSRYSAPSPAKRPGRGFARRMSEGESRERAFVRIGLRAAGLPPALRLLCTQEGSERLNRLFRNARCQPRKD